MRPMGIAAAAIALGTAAAPAASRTEQTGLHGFVRQPTPVCYTDSCDAPAPGVVLRFTRPDGHSARAVTRSTGFYRVVLAPGRYTVTADLRPVQKFSVKTARVLDGHDGRLDFFLDTGIQ